MTWLTAYATALALVVLLDAAWLGRIARSLYREQFGDLMLDKPPLPVAAVFYTLYAAGIVFFPVRSALREAQWQTALWEGALLGLVAYATYNLTSWSSLKRFPAAMVPIDIAWGVLLTAIAAVGAYLAVRMIGQQTI